MIFYFTATGNSKYAAEKLAAQTGEHMIDIAYAWKHNLFDYDISADELLIFVVPVFAETLPGIVGLFIERLELNGYSDQYVYGVFTCGESSGYESAALRASLAAKGISFNGSFDIVMPDNFIVWSDIPPKQRLEAILDEADKTLDDVIKAIKSRARGTIYTSEPEMPYFPLQEISTAKGTSKLYADEKCTACGLCETLCPMRVIIPDYEGKPRWEGGCTMCFACLHRCPSGAVQHGNDTIRKGRYINPYVIL